MCEQTDEYLEFIVLGDGANLYRYYATDDKMHKIMGVGKGNRGKAIRGKLRTEVEDLARKAFKGNLQ